MLPRLLPLLCLLFLLQVSFTQELGKAKPRVPVTKPPAPVSKAGIIYVDGDVHKPIGVSIKDTSPMTALKALATAEGANPTASLHHAKIIRKVENGTTEVPVDIKQIMQAKAPDVTLQAGDILFIPRSSSKSARRLQNEHFYDVPPSDPLQGPTPIYIR